MARISFATFFVVALATGLPIVSAQSGSIVSNPIVSSLGSPGGGVRDCSKPTRLAPVEKVGTARVARLPLIDWAASKESDCAAAPIVKLPPVAEKKCGVVGDSAPYDASDDGCLSDPKPVAIDWQRDAALASVIAQADALSARALGLAERGALYSARAEFFQSLQTIAKAVDAHCGTTEHSQSLAGAIQALKETRDFAAGSRTSAAEVELQAAVMRHSTPVLKGKSLKGMPAVAAMQSYCAYAEDRFAFACAGSPAASRAFCGLGKTYTAIAERTPDADQLNGPQAIVFHKTALAIDPKNYQSANELGVLLARFGQLGEARAALLQSVAVCPTMESWHNLATVHERLGELELAIRARNESQLARQAALPPGNSAGPVPEVHWVDPVAFAQTAECVPMVQPHRTAANANSAVRR